MIRLEKTRDTRLVKEIIKNNNFGGGGHYCNNIEVVKEVKDGPYRIRNILKGNGLMWFYLVTVENKIILIAPLFIRKNEAVVAGTNEWFDFVDFFYSSDASENEIEKAISFLITQMKNEGIKRLHWNWMPNDSASHIIVGSDGYRKSREEVVDNTTIPFSDYDGYKAALSKSTKQNLRTARNRLIRDNKDHEFQISMMGNIDEKIIEDCLKLYYSRQKTKYGVGFLRKLTIKTLDFNTRLLRRGEGVVAAFLIDGEVAAFMYGYINNQKSSLEIPKLAIDDKFGFYSPGMLLVDSTIKYLADNTQIKSLDLCRGTEQYKLKMGGEVYPTYNYTIEL